MTLTKLEKPIYTRIGTCRSGKAFDIPYEMEKTAIKEFLKAFDAHDLVDIFCMCESVIVRVEDSDVNYTDNVSLKKLWSYLWLPSVFATIRPNLIELGLHTSPDYVRFGKGMLLF